MARVANRRGHASAAALLCAARRARNRPAAVRSSFFGNIFTGSLSKVTARGRRRTRHTAQAQPAPAGSAALPWSGEDGASGHPLMTASAIRRGGGEFRQLRRLDVARRRAPQHLASQLPALHRGAYARSAHHGPDGFAAGIHQVDLGLSRHPGERQPPRQGPRDPRQIQAAVRRDRKSLWRRPLCDRGDLGHRVELLDPDGRPQRAAVHRDAGLHRPPPEIFPG